MVGYLRPFTAELLGKEIVRFQSLYCGLCHTLRARYGQLPRLALSYDLTYLALFILAFDPTEEDASMQKCFDHGPFRKKPVAAASAGLDYAADLTLLLTREQVMDDKADGDYLVRRTALQLALGRAIRRAQAARPELAAYLQEAFAQERALTQSPPELDLAQPTLTAQVAPVQAFAQILGEVFYQAPWPADWPQAYRDTMRLVGEDLGAWIYWLDACHDWEEDQAQEAYNPLQAVGREAAWPELECLEQSLDRSLALMPYEQDAALVANLVHFSLPQARARVAAGEGLWQV